MKFYYFKEQEKEALKIHSEKRKQLFLIFFHSFEFQLILFYDLL